MSSSSPPDRSTEFLGHMLKSQRAIRNYLYSLHPRADDLDDLVQQTALILWRDFDKFDSTREFLPWALRVSYFEVLRLRKKQSRERLVFSNKIIEILVGESPGENDPLPTRQALDQCLAKLDPDSRAVLMARYGGEHDSVVELAGKKGVNVHRLYRVLEKARGSVVTCIRRSLDAGEDNVAY